MPNLNRVIICGELDGITKTSSGNVQATLIAINKGWRGAADRQCPVALAAKDAQAENLGGFKDGDRVTVIGHLHSYRQTDDKKSPMRWCVVVESIECESAASSTSRSLRDDEDELPF